jgi:hypothetical protein
MAEQCISRDEAIELFRRKLFGGRTAFITDRQLQLHETYLMEPKRERPPEVLTELGETKIQSDILSAQIGRAIRELAAHGFNCAAVEFDRSKFENALQSIQPIAGPHDVLSIVSPSQTNATATLSAGIIRENRGGRPTDKELIVQLAKSVMKEKNRPRTLAALSRNVRNLLVKHPDAYRSADGEVADKKTIERHLRNEGFRF